MPTTTISNKMSQFLHDFRKFVFKILHLRENNQLVTQDCDIRNSDCYTPLISNYGPNTEHNQQKRKDSEHLAGHFKFCMTKSAKSGKVGKPIGVPTFCLSYKLLNVD